MSKTKLHQWHAAQQPSRYLINSCKPLCSKRLQRFEGKIMNTKQPEALALRKAA